METIHVLSIGNSFSQDAHRYLYGLARSENVRMETVNLYIGGCSLDMHFRNLKGEKKAYSLEIGGHTDGGFFVSIQEALLARRWDYVTLQQASHYSYRRETYTPYMKELAKYVREYAPEAKLMVHETWGYETGSDRLRQHGFENYSEMFARIKECYQQAAEEIHADGVIPGGTMLEKALQAGIASVHRDTFHAKLGVGRFILALIWYKILTGNSVENVKFNDFDEEVSDQEYQLALRIVEEWGKPA